MKYYKNHQLKFYNSFKLSSIAKEIWFPESIYDLKEVMETIKDFNLIANGTNMLLFPEISKVVCLSSMPQTSCNKCRTVKITANTPTNFVVREMLQNKISGWESFLGIPGSIGGAVVMNAGALGREISEHVIKVETLDKEGKIRVYNKEDLNFDRRYSILQDKEDILLNVTFSLKKLGLNQALIDTALANRKTIPKYASAGGIFVNWHTLKPYKEQLIGKRFGDAVISESINIIVNLGEATFEDVMQTINYVKFIVKEPLKLEVKII